MAAKKWVYRFEELDQAEQYVGGQWEEVRGLFGGKGANLAEMQRIGLPVPPGFTITTEACNAYLQAGGVFPEGMWPQVTEALAVVQSATGKRFGDQENPLLVSCRSGAKFSMPGMMDTVLNIGLNDTTCQGMIKLTGDARFVYDAYRRLIQMFGSVVMGISDEAFERVIEQAKQKAGVALDTELSAEDWRAVTEQFKTIFRSHSQVDFPQDPQEQLKMATEAVFKSWNGKRAKDYRNAAGIAHDLGTAVNIVTMVFGNMGDDSATGVAMTRNGSTGEAKIEGDYLVNAQGEDVVAGIRHTEDINQMRAELPDAFQQLQEISDKLEKHYREMQDIEFTIEKGRLWMLQTRDGKRTARAAVRIAVEMVREGLISREEAVLRVSPDQIDFFLHPQFDPADIAVARSQGRMVARGLNVSPGAAFGVAVFDADLAEAWAKNENKKVIMVRPETKPDDVHGMLAAQGILTSRGALVELVQQIRQKGRRRWWALKLKQRNPMLGLHGVRLGAHIPELTKMLPRTDQFPTPGMWANSDRPQDSRRSEKFDTRDIGQCCSDLILEDHPDHFLRVDDSLSNDQNQIIHKTDNESCIFGVIQEAAWYDAPASVNCFQLAGEQIPRAHSCYFYNKIGDETGNLNILLIFYLLIIGAVVGCYLYLAVTGASIPEELRESLKNIIAYCIGIASGIAISPQYPRS